jgi:hypothetical protein
MGLRLLVLTSFLNVALAVDAQFQPSDVPAANPARPTVSTPATLTPVGYPQFETGCLGAWKSPGLSEQSSFNEVAKITVSGRIELLASWAPFARSLVAGQYSNAAGGLSLGVQGVVHHGKGVDPTIALSYFRQVYGGNEPDLDIGSSINSATILFSADLKGFHYDTNYLFNEVVNGSVRRAQNGQTLSVSHPLFGKFGLSGEIWTFTQPFLQGRTVGNLWAVNYNARPTLVFDAGFNRGLTSTSTRWEVFAGFTYLLPHKISLRSWFNR